MTELGRRQIEAVARQVATRCQPGAIYTSPLQRCIDTAAAIGAACGVAAQPAQGLIDIDYGDWQGLSHEEASRRWPAETGLWARTPHLAEIPGGESLARLLARTTATLHGMLRRHPDVTVVAVAHDAVNRVLLLHALDLPLSRFWHLKQEPGAINELEYADGAFVIDSINETQHLAGL